MIIPDVADHVIAMSVVAGKQKTADALFDGAQSVQWGTADTVGGNGKQTGYFLNDHRDGDTTYGTYEATLTDGAMTGAWKLTGGTGKFAHITGSGVGTVKQNTPTEFELTWSGSYNLG